MLKLISLTVGTFILTSTLISAVPSQSSTLNNKVTPTQKCVDLSKAAKRPSTKTVTIRVEGEVETVKVRLYDAGVFSTYYPENEYLVEGASSGEGTGARFISNLGGTRNDDTTVSISYLRSFKNYQQLRNFLLSKRGPIATARLQVVSSTRKDLPYSWAREKFYLRRGNDILGSAYIGQQNGKWFYVVSQYPADSADGFAPRENLILRELQFVR